MLISELSFLLLLLKFSFKIQVVVTLVFDISIYDVWIAFFCFECVEEQSNFG